MWEATKLGITDIGCCFHGYWHGLPPVTDVISLPAKILKKMTLPGLTFGEHCVKFSTLEIIFCVFVAKNYLVKVLTPLKGGFFPFTGVK